MSTDLTLDATEADGTPLSIFDEMAVEVSGYLYEAKSLRSWGVKASPFLDFLKQLFQTLLPLLVGCIPVAQRTAEGLMAAMQNPNLWHRLVMRQEIRAQLRDDEAERALLAPLASGILRMGQGMTTERTTRLLAA